VSMSKSSLTNVHAHRKRGIGVNLALECGIISRVKGCDVTI